MKLFTPSNRYRRALRRIAIFVALPVHLVASDEPVDAKPPELTGISRIKECVLVCAELDGECKWLSAVGGTLGPFKLVGIDPESRYVDFEREGVTTRVRLRDAVVKNAEDQVMTSAESLDAILAWMKGKAVFVGFGELTEHQKDEILMAQLDHVLNYPDYSPEKRSELLTRKLNQERLMNIGPKGISEAEATALGIPPAKAAELNRMHRMAPLLRKLSKEEGRPVALEID